jgi:hypothetical protein
MKTRRRIVALLVPLALFSAAAAWLAFHKAPSADPGPARAAYFKKAQRLYRHELLSMYQPPEEIFTPQGLTALRNVQRLYSPYYLAYLAMGATPVQPDVLYNPWFDAFVLIQDSDGLVNNIVLASSLGAGETPQLKLQQGFWQEVYRRYTAAGLATFRSPRPFEGTVAVIQELRNLTNHYHWPPRVRLMNNPNHFDLYLQRPDQAVYATPVEPGTYVVFNVTGDRLHTNILALPPQATRFVEKVLRESAERSGGNDLPRYNQMNPRGAGK